MDTSVTHLERLFSAWSHSPRSPQYDRARRKAWQHALHCIQEQAFNEQLVALIETLTRIDPSFPAAHLLLSRVYLHDRRFAEARDHAFEQIARSDERYRSAARALLHRIPGAVDITNPTSAPRTDPTGARVLE